MEKLTSMQRECAISEQILNNRREDTGPSGNSSTRVNSEIALSSLLHSTHHALNAKRRPHVTQQ